MTAPFLAACHRRPAPHTPVWLMRQAGRYLPEYRALRERHDFLTVMRTPELAAEATLQPLQRYPLDAAILFADILTPFDGLGLGLSFAPGPVLEKPLHSAAAIDALPDTAIEESAGYLFAAIRAVRRELPPHVPLIGFAGAPFTLFCYLVEGRGGGGFSDALAFLDEEPAAAGRLLDRITTRTLAYLAAQARAGAQALMLFDSWAGLLAPERFAAISMPRLRTIFDGLGGLGVPRLYFPRSLPGADAAAFLAHAAGIPLEVLGVDSRTSLAAARRIAGGRLAVQGNLDPAALAGSRDELDRAIDRVLDAAGEEPGHLFNLGDGVPPSTDPDAVARLVERVHRRTRREAAA
jgi:uroporphyrinogen decarboxylase